MKENKLVDRIRQLRQYHGVLLIDKPKGITSAKVCRILKKVVRPTKLGHAGTLDPEATGLLIVCCGEARKLVSLLQLLPKHYIASIMLGIETDTFDLEGTVVSVQHPPGNWQKQLPTVIGEFCGKRSQMPPKFSAVRIQGKRAYELARLGRNPKVPVREVEIYSLTILHTGTRFFVLDVVCSRGTYIRSLAKDIAGKLGTTGVLADLHRLRIGTFSVWDAMPLEQITKDPQSAIEAFIPLSEAFSFIPHIYLPPHLAKFFRNGGFVPLNEPGIHVRQPDESRCLHLKLETCGVGLVFSHEFTDVPIGLGALDFHQSLLRPKRVFTFG